MPPPPPQPAEVIEHPRATSFDIGPDSAPWRIFVGLPSTPPPPAGYSAILALDGNATFPILWCQRESLTPSAPIAVVGIGYPCSTRFDQARRWFDLTSQHLAIPGVRGPPDGQRTGGRDALLATISAELLPALKHRFPLNMADLTLYGHSLGGLFAMHTLIVNPAPFCRYVAADPSTWWNSGELVREAEAMVVARARTSTPSLVCLCASASWDGPNSLRPSPHDLLAVLSQSPESLLQAELHDYREANHGQLIEPSLERCLRMAVEGL